MSRFFDWIRQFWQDQPPPGAGPAAKGPAPVPDAGQLLDERSVTTLMQLVEKTIDGEYSCQETFDLLDEYVELAASGQDVELLMPLVKKHIDHCPDCGPRFEILLDILENA